MPQTVSQSDFIAQTNALIAQGEHHRAWVQARDYLEKEPTLALYHAVAKFADQLDRTAADLRDVRIALLGSFTLDPIVPILKAQALSSRIVADTYVGQFNTWQQEVLSEASGLRRFNPDVIFLAVRAEELAPALVQRFLHLQEAEVDSHIASTTAALENFLNALRRWSRAKVVVHSFLCPISPALGILDHQSPNGQSIAFRKLNDAWTDTAKSTSDVWIIDCERLLGEIGWSRWYDGRLWALAKMPISSVALERLAMEYVKYLRAFLGLAKKVLALDLDNTLWGGVVGEDGPDGIQLGPDYPGSAFVELQRVLINLHDRGVLLAINSKNNAADASEVLEKHPSMILRPEHFAAMRINWQDKAQNLRELADELNLGLDSFVYVDDSAQECERIRQALPQISTVHLDGEPANRVNRLQRLTSLFDTLSYSTEDRTRSTMYQTENARRQLQNQSVSLEDFYTSLAMELTIDHLTAASAQRAAQLTQRTNQFNLTTHRYSEGEIVALAQSDEHEIYTAHLRDRFGDVGTIALAILKRSAETLHIDTFLMSCRAIGRTVETAFLTFLLRRATELGVRKIVGEYRPTKKNGLVAEFYAQHGFHIAAQTEGGTLWYLNADEFRWSYPRWVQIHTPGE